MTQQYFLLLHMLVGCVIAQWQVDDFDLYAQNNPWYARFGGGFTYTHRDSPWSLYGSGWVDTSRNWGATLGVSFRFRKRSVHGNEEHFHLLIRANQCRFAVYDRNDDGMVTRDELHALFADEILAEKLFMALDITTGDDAVTIDEFYFMAPKLIYGCEPEPEVIASVEEIPNISEEPRIPEEKTTAQTDTESQNIKPTILEK